MNRERFSQSPGIVRADVVDALGCGVQLRGEARPTDGCEVASGDIAKEGLT